MAGGRRQFYALAKDRQAELLKAAKELFGLGLDYGTAEKAERTDRRGFVYVISHPRFPGYVKIGRAFNPESRLRGYQTGCPERAYKLDYAVYFDDCHKAETDIHYILQQDRVKGEWFAIPRHVAEGYIDAIRRI